MKEGEAISVNGEINSTKGQQRGYNSERPCARNATKKGAARVGDSLNRNLSKAKEEEARREERQD